jgi:hypothetical protein
LAGKTGRAAATLAHPWLQARHSRRANAAPYKRTGIAALKDFQPITLVGATPTCGSRVAVKKHHSMRRRHTAVRGHGA